MNSQGSLSANSCGVYASTSSFNVSKGSGFGLSQLESMGWIIKDDNDAIESKYQ
jgi:hypothetical protein